MPVNVSCDGTHTLDARAADVAGHVVTATRSIRVDTVPPLGTGGTTAPGTGAAVPSTGVAPGAAMPLASGPSGEVTR